MKRKIIQFLRLDKLFKIKSNKTLKNKIFIDLSSMPAPYKPVKVAGTLNRQYHMALSVICTKKGYNKQDVITTLLVNWINKQEYDFNFEKPYKIYDDGDYKLNLLFEDE